METQPTVERLPIDDQDPAAILGVIEAVAYDWDIVNDKLVWGHNVAEVIGNLPADALRRGDGYARLVSVESETSRYQEIFNGSARDEGDGALFRVRYRIVVPGDGLRDVEDFGRWFADADGRPCRARGIVRVLGRAEIGETLASPTPSLGSRRAFNAWVDDRCVTPRGNGSQLALIVVGVSNLSDINAREGYDVGDEVITAIGRKIAQGLRGGDRVVRYCGGKFALLVALGAQDQPATAAQRIAKRINGEFFKTSAGPIRAGVNIGVALSPRDGRAAHLLMQRADEACSKAAALRETIAIYSADELEAQTRRQASWVADEIVAALNDRRIFLMFQPIAPTHPDLLPFEEALMRLRLADGGILGPGSLIPVAERLGLIELLDARVLELSIARLAEEPNCRLSVNVSVASLVSPLWFERLRDNLAAAPGAAERLIIEIVETQMVENVAEVSAILSNAKSLGVQIAMDDFGAGHTSFRNLRALGIDIVKIDGAFVSGLASSVDDRFFVRTLASLAKHLHIKTVAEWVEDEESARLLTEWGVDYLQGYFIGRAELAKPQALPEISSSLRFISAS